MPVLSSNSQRILLKLARTAIETCLKQEKPMGFDSPSGELLLPRGCFVTLRKSGHLRGCIGTFDPSQPVYKNVSRMAAASATEDPRFSPVTLQELPEIRIEISILGETLRMRFLEEIEIGRHGVLIKYGYRSGTYLPDVAVEQKWTAEEFVRHCALEKAGLTPEEFSRAEIFLYEVQKFSEKD
jgi:AmmeMemoRadiSam system protein A